MPISLYLKSPFILIVNPSAAGQDRFPSSSSMPRRARAAAQLSVRPGTGGLPLPVDRAHEAAVRACNMTHVPYRNSRRRSAMWPPATSAWPSPRPAHRSPLIRDGKVRALAVSSTQRLPAHPSVPPFAEAANAPDFETVSWHVLMAPAKTPRPIVERLHAEMKRIMESTRTCRSGCPTSGLIPLDPPSIADTERYIKSETREMERAGEEARIGGLAVVASSGNRHGRPASGQGGAGRRRRLRRPGLGQRPRHRRACSRRRAPRSSPSTRARMR